LHVVVFLSVHALKRDAQRRSTRQRYAENNQFPDALLTSKEVATIFSSASTSLNQLGTRVSHTKGARSRLVDLMDIVLPCSLRRCPSLRWLMTQGPGPLSCSGSALSWVFPSLPLPISVGVELTFILFSASQRHLAWDIRWQNPFFSKNGCPK
jgi:hypothetical protein